LNVEALETLEARGLFVTYCEGTYRPFRVARQVDANALPASAAPTDAALLVVRMFGRFESTIDEKAVPWLRRMDRRIFRYLVLTRDGSATKDEIFKEFWANADERQASQSLRTACSNIRKAIGTLVGTERVDEYFNAGENVSVNLDNVTVDVRRFISHIRNAAFAYESDDIHSALIHYKRAESLYTGRLGWGDEEESALIPLAQECEQLYLLGLTRIAEILRKTGAAVQAMRYETILNEKDMRRNAAQA